MQQTEGESSSFSKILKNLNIYQALILGFAPIAICSLVYIYELGYGSYFNVPTGFVSLSLTALFSTGTIVLFAISSLLLYLGIHYSVRRPKHVNNLQILLNNMLTLFAVSIFFIVYKDYATIGIWLFWLLTAVVFIRHGLLPIVWHRSTKGLDNKYEKHVNKVIKKTDTYTDYVFNFTVFRYAPLAILTIAAILFVFHYGLYKASSQENFFTYKMNKVEYIAVRQIDDKALLVSYTDNKIGDKLKLLDLTEKDVELIYKQLGRLKR